MLARINYEEFSDDVISEFSEVANPMTKQEAREWIAALRSGKYQQGHGELKTERGDGNFSYCCLGVEQQVHPDRTSEVNDAFTLKQEGRRGTGEDNYTWETTVHRLPEVIQDALAVFNDGWAAPGNFYADGRLRFFMIAYVIEMDILPHLVGE